MVPTPSEIPIVRHELARVENRLSFLYVELAVVNRDNNSLTVSDKRGVAYVPATTLAVLLLGPGTRVTYSAMALLGDSGVSVVWVGERGVRYYAHGRSIAKSSRMAMAQAEIVTHQRRRLACARAMYRMRFGNEDVSSASMAQLRGREGARMKRVYVAEAERTGVKWSRRQYDPNDFDSGDEINKALTSANAALYGVIQAVVVSLGLIPALGVIHSGTDRGFVYDIADLYKADISIPAAFDAVVEPNENIGSQARRNVRDRIVSYRLMQKCVRDLYALMEMPLTAETIDVDLLLWSELEMVEAGLNWSSDAGNDF